MLHPIMSPKRADERSSSERSIVAPSTAGATAARFPAAQLPPPYLDERLVTPETREERVRGRRLYVLPANPEHGDRHTELDRVIGNYTPEDYIASTDLLTRAGPGSDFATDTCIRRAGIDPRTGSRYLEEVAFEVVNTQTVANMVERARMLTECGVRRVFAIFVDRGEVAEWSPEQDRFITLTSEDSIEDRTLVRPLRVGALLDATEADEAVARALKAKGNSVIAEVRAEGRTEGRAEGLTEGRLESVEIVCNVLSIPLGPARRARLTALDAEGLRNLCVHLETQRRWPSG